MDQIIRRITLSRLKNQTHVQFNESISSLIEKISPKILDIEILYEFYCQVFNNELEALDIILKSELTPQIFEQDKTRDSVFRGFSDTVKGFRNHFNPEYRDAANKLWSVFLHYGNITIKPLDAETAAINDMLREFKQTKFAEAIDKLQLNSWVEKLEEENKKFHQLMMNRYQETVGITAYRMKTARLETDKYYRAMLAQLENQVLMKKDNQQLKECISEWNAIVKRFKDILAQEFGRKNKISND